MRAIEIDEGKQILESLGIQYLSDPDNRLPRYAKPNSCRAFEVTYEDGHPCAQDLAKDLLTPSAAPAFPGGLIWLSQWGLGWNAVAEYTLRRFMHGYGIDFGYRANPVIVVDGGEARDAVATMALMMTFDCDCFFVAADASYLVLRDNKFFLTVVTASEHEYQWYRPIIEALDFSELRGDRNTFCCRGK